MSYSFAIDFFFFFGTRAVVKDGTRLSQAQTDMESDIKTPKGPPGKGLGVTDFSHLKSSSCICTRKRLCLVTVPCVAAGHFSETARFAWGTRST